MTTLTPPPAWTPPLLTYTAAQFTALFTTAEWAAVTASTDTTVKTFVSDVASTTPIRLASRLVMDGVNYLASVKLLTPARAAMIRSGQPAPAAATS